MELAHYTVSTVGRRPLARDEAERRRILRAVAELGGERLLVFCLVDEHLHNGLGGERLGFLGREIRNLLGHLRPDLELEPGHMKPVVQRGHLQRLVSYCVRQPIKHGLAGVHPALYSGSCFQDLIGVRVLEGFSLSSLRVELPRLSQRELLPVAGLFPIPIDSATDDELRRSGAARIVRLAADTFAVGPELIGSERAVLRARALAVRTALGVGFSPRDLAQYLHVGLRTVQRLATSAVDRRGETALRRRLTLEDRVAQQAMSAATRA